MAERTGTGHKSSANALEAKLKSMGFITKQLDCFKTMGKMGEKMENSYISLTVNHPFIWKISHTFSQVFTNTLHSFIYNHCKKRMLAEILEFNPDLIITVHCMFTKAISKLLRKNKLNIPFMVSVIDLVKPPKVWRDKSANLTFVPTENVYDEYLKLGFDKSKLVISGFPIREDIVPLTQPKEIKGKINILMVNPSINTKKNIKFVKEIAKIKNVNISFVCGRDEKLHKALIKEQQKNIELKNVKVFGFIKNINELLSTAHILLTKAGPNMLLEGTRSGTAVVVTGHIPGQEVHNYKYIVDNGFGIKCENPNKIYEELNSFISSKKLNECLKNVTHIKYNDGTHIIVEKIQEYLSK